MSQPDKVAEPKDPLPTMPRAWRCPAAWVLLLAVFASGLAVDLSSKTLTFRHVNDEPVVLDRDLLLSSPDFDPIDWRIPGKPVLPLGLMEFKLVLNPGAVFGIGASHRWFFILFTLSALSAGLLVFGRYTTRRDRLAHVAIGLILAGGLGNLCDRIAFGRVRDFIHMLPGRRLPFDWTWLGTQNPEMFPWVFNVADAMLLTGMVLLMIHIDRAEKRRKRRKSDEPERPDAERQPQ